MKSARVSISKRHARELVRWFKGASSVIAWGSIVAALERELAVSPPRRKKRKERADE